MDLNELRERQSWPLEKKIDHSILVIDTFLSRTNCNAFVSFSGGKDSTVLLDLVRHFTELAYGDANIIPAMFVNTGNEYPDIVHFVRHLKEDSGYNIEIVRPSKTPRQVWAEKGFPLIGKEQAEYIYRCRKNPNAINLINDQLSKGNTFGVVSRKWQYLIDAPYDTSQACCGLLKKAPAHAYQKRTKRFPIIGTMAEESKLRESIYIRRGGGAFRLRKMVLQQLWQLLYPFGRRLTSGTTSRNLTSKYQTYTIRERSGQGALAVASVASSSRTTDLKSSIVIIRSTTR
ncbi:MAG: phosphoadenosine phosphosulfate reductase family protein [Bacteroidales bacterium]|nr:phosphoadenosine phosphosulfate reductase family protein [Bacteroidales bacterium]